ncbi:hypothetical protein FH036_23195 [Bacillus sp. CD3-5]|nr:hypothetical protein FH036_23195 [Bacillus sp. CD3-5]
MTVSFMIFILTWSNYVFFGFFSNLTSLALISLNLFMLFFYLPIIMSKNKKDMLFLLISIIFIMMNAILSDSNVGGIIVISNILLMMVLFKYILISEKYIILISFVMFMFFLFFNYSQHIGYNPNSIGYIVFLTFVYSNFYLIKYKVSKLILPLISIAALYAISLTDNRGSLIALIMFLLLSYFVPAKIWGNKYVFSILTILLTVGSIAFVFTYVFMWKNNIILEMSWSDKSFYTGREFIWSELVEGFKNHPIIGLGTNYHIMSNSNLNIHNSMFNVLVVYGVPVFLFTTMLILNRLKSLSNYILINKNVRIAVSGFLSVLLVGFFETNLLWSTNNFPALFLLVIAFSSCKLEEA